jgi:Mn-dependent DtxR family transcriptional regulator
MMTTVLGLLFAGAVLFSPIGGILPLAIRRRRLASSVACDDVLAALYRLQEADPGPTAAQPLRVSSRARRTLLRAGLVHLDAGTLRLTPSGLAVGASLVRRHRLWEHYLVDKAGLRPDHVHQTAEALEHMTAVEGLLPEPPDRVDPHGRPIPRVMPPTPEGPRGARD